jgi:hypothetical protein
MPPLPDPNFSRFGHGISLLGGWFPLCVKVITIVVLIVGIGRRSRRWWLIWARSYMNSEGLASAPAPLRLWVWTSVCAKSIAVTLLGFPGASWWRRGLSVAAIPLTLVCALIVLSQWVGYYPTLQKAWGDLTSGPLPDQIDAEDVTGLRNTEPGTGKVVPIDTPDGVSGFKHRTEYVYLPPIWFSGPAPPRLSAG